MSESITDLPAMSPGVSASPRRGGQCEAAAPGTPGMHKALMSFQARNKDLLGDMLGIASQSFCIGWLEAENSALNAGIERLKK